MTEIACDERAFEATLDTRVHLAVIEVAIVDETDCGDLKRVMTSAYRAFDTDDPNKVKRRTLPA